MGQSFVDNNNLYIIKTDLNWNYVFHLTGERDWDKLPGLEEIRSSHTFHVDAANAVFIVGG